jgi:hypothetical protein
MQQVAWSRPAIMLAEGDSTDGAAQRTSGSMLVSELPAHMPLMQRLADMERLKL